MSEYQIDYSVDGHPICFNNVPLSKKETLNELNELSAYSAYQAKALQEIKSLQQQCDALVKALGDLVGDNLPPCYEDEDDDCGHCPYCGNLAYKEHDETCKITVAEKLIADYKERSNE